MSSGTQQPLENISPQNTDPELISVSSFEYVRPPWLTSGRTDSLTTGMGTSGAIWSSFSGSESVNTVLHLNKSWSRVKFARQHPLLALQNFPESCKTCSICLSDIRYEDGDVCNIAGCKHWCHEGCISRWKKKRPKCPLCRSLLTAKDGKIGAKKQLHSLEHVYDVILLLLLENQNPLSPKERIRNIVLAPFGFALVLLTIPLLLVSEMMFVCLASPVLFISLLLETFRDRFGIRCNKCGAFLLGCYSIIVSVSLLLPVAVFIIAQIPFFVYFTIIFIFKVCRCKRRWQDVIPYMANRMIFDSV